MPIDPVILERLLAGLATPAHEPADIHERRERALAAETAFWADHRMPPPAVETVDVNIGAVRVRMYRGADGIQPGMVQFFGGAFRQGGLHHPVTDWLYRDRAARSGVTVIGVDSALAPEHPYPAAIEQGVAVLHWLREHGESNGIDATRIGIGGQSSGGNIAACVALRNRDEPVLPLRFQLLEVPVLDLTTGHMSFELLAELGIPEEPVRRDHHSIRDDYFGGAADDDPGASPLLQSSLADLPPTYLMLAEYDVLLGDGAAYHARLRDAGVPSSATVALGQTHDSAGDHRLLASQHWQRDVVGILRSLHDLP